MDSGICGLADNTSIAIAVLSTSQDDVHLVNSTLREAGHPAHCHWIQTPGRFADVLHKETIELVILNTDLYVDSIRQVIKDKEGYIPEVPVLALASTVTEEGILKAMQNGACDMVSIHQKGRMQAVISRELRAFRVERALNSTLHSATEYRKLLNDYMQNSPTAIAYVQEGIVNEANNAWISLFEAGKRDDVIGLPLMDNFVSESHAAIKGALVATLQSKWQEGEKLIVKSTHVDNDKTTLELEFQLAELDEGPHVQIRIAPQIKPVEEPTKLVHDALKRDPTTLFFHRAQFLDRITKRLSRKPKSGIHVLVYIKPDNFSEIRKAAGIIDSEEVLALLSEELRRRLHPRDVAGRFEGTVIMALLERGNERDAEVWGRQLVDHVNGSLFTIGEQQLSITCTVGVVGVSGVYSSLEEIVAAAANAHQSGKRGGGNTVHLRESTDDNTRMRKYDEMWVKRIKTAMTENRFRLAQLPIAGLRSDSTKMFDMLVRMIDEQGDTVIPSEFLPAAERSNLMKIIDRWMVTASIDFTKKHAAEKVFIRLSRQSMQDSSLVNWLKTELDRHDFNPSRLVVQIPEQEAARFIKETKAKVLELRELGVMFAIEHYGVDKNRFQILDIIKPNFIKIDGELMHSLMTDTDLQQAVSALASAASERNIETIAERVENANEMAVLFQLGVHFMQGHYVHEPEVVLQEPVCVESTTLDAMNAG
jgi:diguanylate cyclase (GGDEF)-like protein